MGDVAEQRSDRGVRRDRSESAPAGESAPDPLETAGAVSETGQPGTELTPAGQSTPGDLDPEQLRQVREFQQFREFQRFQQLLRHQQEQHGPLSTTLGAEITPATPTRPSRRLPGWARWLGRKLLAWLIFFLLLALFTTWAVNELVASEDDNSTQSAVRKGGGTYHTEELLAKEPYEAVRKVYDAIAQEDPTTNQPLIAQACGHFDNDNNIAQRFAENTGGHPDCRQAVIALHAQVTHVNDYAESIHPRWYDPSATAVRIDSCDFDVQGGPALGVFTVTRVEMGQWLITSHEPGPTACAPKSTTTEIPTGN